MKIFDSNTIKEWDAFTIAKEPITSIDLMERAALNIAEFLRNRFSQNNFIICCGQGNNGGDGYALGRILRNKGAKVKVYGAKFSKKFSPDCETNKALTEATELTSAKDFSNIEIQPDEIIIDCIFGSGINSVPTGDFEEWINLLNQFPNYKISIDLPSGLPCDALPEGTVFKCNLCLSLQSPKISLLIPESENYCDEMEIIDIGLHTDFENITPSSFAYLTQNDIDLPILKKFAHKGKHGHGLLIAGSYCSMGAAVLAARAAIHSGIGKLTCASPRLGINILQATVPEALCIPDRNEEINVCLPDLSNFNAIAIGPGIGQDPQTIDLVDELLREAKIPLILDADAINIIAKKGWIKKIPENSILTPHIKEFDHLFGAHKDTLSRIKTLKEISLKHGLNIVLKGAHSIISCGGDSQIYFNSTGNPAMATAGTGDVLTGIILALLAKGLPAHDALKTAVFEHGRAADETIILQNSYFLKAGDMVSNLFRK